MQAEEWDEIEFFRALANGGARVLLIGRQALIALGVPVITADYDLWVHMDDVAALNAALRPLDLMPNRQPEEVRQRSRYVLEGEQHVDVLAARSQTTKDGVVMRFDDVWARRQSVPLDDGVAIAMPSIEDLIGTKRFAMRPKDLPDIQLLEALLAERTNKS